MLSDADTNEATALEQAGNLSIDCSNAGNWGFLTRPFQRRVSWFAELSAQTGLLLPTDSVRRHQSLRTPLTLQACGASVLREKRSVSSSRWISNIERRASKWQTMVGNAGRKASPRWIYIKCQSEVCACGVGVDNLIPCTARNLGMDDTQLVKHECPADIVDYCGYFWLAATFTARGILLNWAPYLLLSGSTPNFRQTYYTLPLPD